MDPISMIKAAGTAIDSVKKISETARRIENNEILLWAADLQGDIITLKSEILDLRQQNLHLKEQLKNAIDLKNYFFKDNAYWEKKEAKDEGPYCSPCFDDRKKPVRLTKLFEGSYVCNVCKSSAIVSNLSSKAIKRVSDYYE